MGGRILARLPRVPARHYAAVPAELHAGRARIRANEKRIPLGAPDFLPLSEQDDFGKPLVVDDREHEVQQHEDLQGKPVLGGVRMAFKLPRGLDHSAMFDCFWIFVELS